MAIGLIIALLFSGGVSFAAEGALPGDILYPVKVGINEEVASLLKFNNEAKANWNARIVERRLEEAEKLALKGGLNSEARAKIESNFERHAERVRERVVRFESEKNLRAAADIDSNFETSLRAHENTLNRISEKRADSESEVRPILLKVRSKIAESAESRARLEAAVETRTNGEFKQAAVGKLKAAENKIEEAEKFLEASKNSVEVEVAAKAEAELNLAIAAVSEAEAKIAAEAYGAAFVILQRVIRIAQNAKLMIRAEKRLEVEINVGTTSDEKESKNEMNARKKENGDSGQIKTGGEMELEAGSKSDSAEVNGNVRLKLELGL